MHVAIAVVTTIKRLLLLPTIRTQIYLFPTDKADFSFAKVNEPTQFSDSHVAHFLSLLLMLSTNHLHMIEKNHNRK